MKTMYRHFRAATETSTTVAATTTVADATTATAIRTATATTGNINKM